MGRFEYKRLSKDKNWKIKKFTNGNGYSTFKCYHRNFFGIWQKAQEWDYDQFHSDFIDVEFDTIEEADDYIKDMCIRNHNYYNDVTFRVETVERPKSKQEMRQDKIDSII